MDTYDILIIGGGIQGVGVAQAAAAKGLRALLLEKNELGCGTSQRSSKLIHGGLRYLESFQFSLVRESLNERKILLNIAPELVELRPFHIPVYETSKRSSMLIRLGLSLYSVLGGLDSDNRFKVLPRSSWGELDGLETKGLKNVFQYYDAQTNDLLLTEAVAKSALSLGAVLKTNAEFVQAHINGEGCEIEYRYSGGKHSAKAKVIVNCAGPWGAEVMKRISPQLEVPTVELIQGSHLLLPPVVKNYYYLDSINDGRSIFILPWEGKVLLGTTETEYSGDPSEVRCLESEQKYLLSTFCHYFPSIGADRLNFSTISGLRVLPKQSGLSFHRPRDVMFFRDHQSSPKVLSVMGGKLTTYRQTAQKVLKVLSDQLPAFKNSVDTATLKL